MPKSAYKHSKGESKFPKGTEAKSLKDKSRKEEHKENGKEYSNVFLKCLII